MGNQEAKKLRRSSPEEIQTAVQTIADTKAGKILLRDLAIRCHMYNSTISGDPQKGEINDRMTQYNEAQRRLYLDIRRQMTPKQKSNIEYGL